MARAWIINSRSLAKKVTSATGSSAHQINDCGANRECPNCHYLIDNSDVSYELPGLPAGVKFDPSDSQLLEHLAAKCGLEDSEPHMLLNEFIPTLEEDQGINYTHPEYLPGAKKNGSSVHFFHRTVNAYATGQRKRRKIDGQEEHVRWHKTGKTKAVIVEGVHLGWKKIMVLYKSSKKSKPNKSNWVMHQYHLGTEEDEKEGEYVVSKILYQQPKQSDKTDDSPITEDPVTSTLRITDDTVTSTLWTSPRTPKTNPPNPPRSGESIMCEDIADDYISLTAMEAAFDEASHDQEPAIQLLDDMGYSAWLAGESQAFESSVLNYIDNSLISRENLNSSALLNTSGLNQSFAHNTNEVTENCSASHGVSELENLEHIASHGVTKLEKLEHIGSSHGVSKLKNLEHNNASHGVSELDNLVHSNACHGVFELENLEHIGASHGVSELENLELDTPPDFQLADLEFGSQDSIFGLFDGS